MLCVLPGGGRKILLRKEMPGNRQRERAIVVHAFGMPVHRQQKAFSGGFAPFDRFDNAVGRGCGAAQMFGQIRRRLMMRTVDSSFCRPAYLGNQRAGFHFDGMIAFDVIDGAMLDVGGNVGGNIHRQRRAERDVDDLQSAADAENGHFEVLRLFKESKFGFVADKVNETIPDAFVLSVAQKLRVQPPVKTMPSQVARIAARSAAGKVQRSMILPAAPAARSHCS